MELESFNRLLPALLLLLSEIATAAGLPSCPGRPGWVRCNLTTGELCLAPAQVCDGVSDCRAGEDEVGCDALPCPAPGLRCSEGGTCLRLAHRAMCTGTGLGPRCSDGSDQAHCLHRIYTGCFHNSSGLGLTITDCSRCLCAARDPAARPGAAMLYRSVGSTHRTAHIVGGVCLLPSDPRVCDGNEDCTAGQDEDPQLCSGRAGRPEPRAGRNLQLRGNGTARRQPSESGLETESVVGMLVGGAVLAAGLLVGLAGARWWRGSRQTHTSDARSEPTNTVGNVYVVNKTPARWSLSTSRVVRQLGRGGIRPHNMLL